MNGIHDMGGMEGFGPVCLQPDEPVFHQPWERTVFAAVMGCMAQGVFTIDEFRHAIERMGNAHYVQGSYYEHWLAGLEILMTEKGLLEAEQIEQRCEQVKQEPAATRTLKPAGDDPLASALQQGIATGAPSEREVADPPRFKPGDRVRTRNLNPRGHTRLPGYARGRNCVVHAHHGAHILPDANAHGRGEAPQHLYSVRFASSEVWGAESDRVAGSLYLDVWENYLDTAD